MFNSLKNLFGGKKQSQAGATSAKSAPPRFEDDEPEIAVPERKPAAIFAALQAGESPLIVDVREGYEWKQTRVKAGEGLEVVHIPMNSIPTRLGELPHDREIAVICASGSRSYGVAHYLIEHGFKATNVEGGIGAWVRAGGAYEQG